MYSMYLCSQMSLVFLSPTNCKPKKVHRTCDTRAILISNSELLHSVVRATAGYRQPSKKCLLDMPIIKRLKTKGFTAYKIVSICQYATYLHNPL